MLQIFKKLNGSGEVSSRELRDALDGINLNALGAAVTAAEQERKTALLSGDEKALSAAERRLQAARASLEHGEIANGALIEQVAEAEKREGLEVLKAKAAEAESEAAELARTMRNRLGPIHAELASLYERIRENHIGLSDLNAKLGAAGLPLIIPAELRARPSCGHGGHVHPADSIAGLAQLLEIEDLDAPGFASNPHMMW